MALPVRQQILPAQVVMVIDSKAPRHLRPGHSQILQPPLSSLREALAEGVHTGRPGHHPVVVNRGGVRRGRPRDIDLHKRPIRLTQPGVRVKATDDLPAR